jgi:transcriptional regulator with XRE-family HTH domain
VEDERWDHIEFARWVRSQLRRREWTEADLTRRLGVSTGAVSRWMRGDRRPSTHSCDLIADAFGVDTDLVLSLAGHRPAAKEPDDDRDLRSLIAKLSRVRLDSGRVGTLEAILDQWADFDREVSASAR